MKMKRHSLDRVVPGFMVSVGYYSMGFLQHWAFVFYFDSLLGGIIVELDLKSSIVDLNGTILHALLHAWDCRQHIWHSSVVADPS